MPIHSLLKQYKVDIVFHGHDHIFAKQELDGIIYQCVSQPGAIRRGNTRIAEEYGYKSGVILNEPGYLKVSIKKDDVQISLISSDSSIKKTVYEYSIKSK